MRHGSAVSVCRKTRKHASSEGKIVGKKTVRVVFRVSISEFPQAFSKFGGILRSTAKGFLTHCVVFL